MHTPLYIIGIESSIKYTLGNQGYCTVIYSHYIYADLESELSDYLCEHLVDPSTGRKVMTNFLEGVAAYHPNN